MPTNVAISTRANGALEITWVDAATTETNYQVERRAGSSGSFQQVALLAANTTQFIDDTVLPTLSYCYRVRATAGTTASPFAEMVCTIAPVPELGAWIVRSSMPTARQEMAGIDYNGEIFVAGGLNADGVPHRTLEIYNVATGAWRAGAPMPEARHHNAAVRIGDKLYWTGGFIGGFPNWAGTTSLWQYDPATNTWTERAPMPEPRGGHAAAAINGKIYVVGGTRGHNDEDHTARNVLIYDPQTNSWSSGALMQVGREHLAAAAIGGKIYVVGGRETHNQGQFGSTTTNFNTLEAYDVATNTWQMLAPMPTARGGLFAAAHDAKLYVFGGEFPGIFPEVEEYNPATNSWRSLVDMAQPRHAAAAVTVGDTIFTIGGGPVFGFSESRTNHGFLPPR